MARVIGERFGSMKEEDIRAVMGKQGEGSEGGKHVKQEGSQLTIKSEPGAEAEKVVISAIVPAEEPSLIPYCVKADEEEDCETIGTDSEVEEINKEEVRGILKKLAGLKHKEAECFDRLAKAVPDMQDNEVVIIAEKVRGTELPQCVYQMSQRIENPRDFQAALAAGERLYSMYKFHQAGMHPCPSRSYVIILILARQRFMSCYEVKNTGIPPKKKWRKNLSGEFSPKELKEKSHP